MARRVKVSAISAWPVSDDFSEGPDGAVKKMKAHWDNELSNVLCDKPDLVVIPELCDRFGTFTPEQNLIYSFTPEQNLAYYRYRGDKLLRFFADYARENNCYIAYPHMRMDDNGTGTNCVALFGRNGQTAGVYDKYHVPGTSGTCGNKAVVFDCDFGRVGAVICWDLNFYDILKLYKEKKPELVIFPSMYHGSFMQNFWAYELRCYFVSACAGKESAVINPVGEKIARTTNYFRYLTSTVNLDYCVIHLNGHFEKIAQIKAKHGDKVTMFDPGFLGAVLLTSETDEFFITDIIKEFELKLLDDYFDECLAGEIRKSI